MKLFKHTLIYGAVSGLVMVSSWGISHYLFAPEEGEIYDFSKGEFIGYTAMIIALSVVFIGVKTYRDRELGRVIGFKDAFFTGLYIVLCASAIYVIGWMIYYPNFMSDFADQYGAYQMQQYRAQGLSDAEIAVREQEMIEWMDTYQRPEVMIAMTFMEIFPIGLIVAVISAWGLKRKG